MLAKGMRQSTNNMYIATIPIDTPGFRGYGATADEMQYIKVWF